MLFIVQKSILNVVANGSLIWLVICQSYYQCLAKFMYFYLHYSIYFPIEWKWIIIEFKTQHVRTKVNLINAFKHEKLHLNFIIYTNVCLYANPRIYWRLGFQQRDILGFKKGYYLSCNARKLSTGGFF